MAFATAKVRTTDGTVAVKVLTGAVAHFTTMAATDSVTLRKGSSTGTIIAKLQPAANNTSVEFHPSIPIKVNDEVEADVLHVEFEGTAAGTVSVYGY